MTEKQRMVPKVIIMAALNMYKRKWNLKAIKVKSSLAHILIHMDKEDMDFIPIGDIPPGGRGVIRWFLGEAGPNSKYLKSYD